MTALAETLEQVSPDQIKHFDHEASQLIADYHLAGWRSHLTSGGHVFLKAPDGSETTSVSRESLRGRSGRNAAAPLKRWRRRMEAEQREREAAARKGAGASFGISDVDRARAEDFGVPPRVAAQIRKHPAVEPYIRANSARLNPENVVDAMYIGVDLEASKPWEMWTLVDVTAGVLIAHGPGYTRHEALKMLRDEGKLPPATEEELVMQAVDNKCPECGFQATNTSGLRMHVRSKHTGYVCPECGKKTGYSGRGLATHRQAEHGITSTNHLKVVERTKRANQCPECGEGCMSPQGLAAHRRVRHIRDVRAEVFALVTSLGRPVRRQDLLEHLGITLSASTSLLVRMRGEGVLVGTGKRGMYELATGTTGDVPVTSPDVTPDGDTETDRDVPMTSRVVPVDDMPAPDEITAVDMVAKLRAIVAPALLAENAALRAERDQLVHDNELLSKELDDSRTLLGMLNEFAITRGGGGVHASGGAA